MCNLSFWAYIIMTASTFTMLIASTTYSSVRLVVMCGSRWLSRIMSLRLRLETFLIMSMAACLELITVK